MKNYIKSLSVVASAVVLSASAFASDYTGSNFGDLILGFNSSNNVNVTVNLGEFTKYSKFDGSTFAVDELAFSDLSTTYGPSWKSSAVTWGVAGAVDQAPYVSPVTGLKTPNSTLFFTAPNTVSSANTVTLADGSANIAGVYSGLRGEFGVTIGAGSNVNTAIYQAGDAGSFSNQQSAQPGLNFGVVAFDVTTTADVSTMNLYGLVPTNAFLGHITEANFKRGVNLLGTFTLGDSGLSYASVTAPSAIPEPSTYAALAGAAVLGLAAFRRRSAVRA